MKLLTLLNDTVEYFADAIARIFGLGDDIYPETGVQPFSGDIVDVPPE